MDYLLATGIAVVGFLGLSLLLMRVLVNAMAIKTLIYALPVG